MTIQLKLEKISPEERKRLRFAFDNGFSQVVGLPDGSFVGVNCEFITNLKIIEQQGSWYCGWIST